MLLDALRDARALLLPLDCAGCGAPDRALCSACLDRLEAVVVARRTAGGLVVHSGLRYESQVRRVILAIKEEGRTDAARSLAPALLASIRAAAGDRADVVVVPVPASRRGTRRRGFDPVQLLLRRAGVRAERMLVPARTAAVQKSLGLEQRAGNRRGSLLARPSARARQVVLVDDVLTSGATLEEAARALVAAGGTVVGAATLAFTPRLRGGRDFHGAEDYGGD